MTNKMRKLARKQLVVQWLPTGSSGSFAVRRFEITKEGADDYNRHMAENENAWARTRHVSPGMHTGLYEFDTSSWLSLVTSTDPWMSDTPAEVLDHCNVMIQMVKRGGRVLINGLGLGMIAAYALRRPNVTHVDVIELQGDIINLVGPHLPNQEKLTLHHVSAYDIEWNDERWNVAWHDIWPTINPDNLPDMDRLEAKYADRVDYQETWVREQCEEAVGKDAAWLDQVDAPIKVRYVPGTPLEKRELELVRKVAEELNISEREVIQLAMREVGK
jgi:hypothetical protein